jgi:hypothetical protein
MNNLIEDYEPEISQISPIEKPKRVMNEKTRDALAAGRVKALEKKALDKIQKNIPEPILKKKVKIDNDDAPIETPKPTPKRKQKQVIVIQSDDDSDDDAPQIIIRTKSSKKADIPPPIPKVIETVIESEPEPIKYRMKRI